MTRAHAQELETEQLSVDEAKASAKRLRDAGKTVSNQSILLEVMEREALSNRKKSRKQRHKEEQSYKQVQATPRVEAVELVESEAEEATREAAIKSLSRGFKKIDKKVLQEVAREYS